MPHVTFVAIRCKKVFEAVVVQTGVLLINHSDAPFPIHRGERIAQMVVAAVVRAELIPAVSLSTTSRGSGGFGSTGR